MDSKKQEFLEILRKTDPGHPIFTNPYLTEEKIEEMIENGVNNYDWYGNRTDDINWELEGIEDVDEASLQVKKRVEEIKEDWRKEEMVEFDEEQFDDEESDSEKSDNTKPKTTTSTDKPTELEMLKAEWDMGMAKRFIIRLEENGLITPIRDIYDWNDSIHLYAYFVWEASKKLKWLYGKDNSHVPWRKFSPMFPNMVEKQPIIDQYIREIKKGTSMPSKAKLIDEILK